MVNEKPQGARTVEELKPALMALMRMAACSECGGNGRKPGALGWDECDICHGRQRDSISLIETLCTPVKPDPVDFEPVGDFGPAYYETLEAIKNSPVVGQPRALGIADMKSADAILQQADLHGTREHATLTMQGLVGDCEVTMRLEMSPDDMEHMQRGLAAIMQREPMPGEGEGGTIVIHNHPPRVVVEVNKGMVQAVLTNGPVEVVVLDFDEPQAPVIEITPVDDDGPMGANVQFPAAERFEHVNAVFERLANEGLGA